MVISLLKRSLRQLVFLLIFFSLSAYSSEPMRSITTYDGLAGESVFKIFRSRWGVIWIGTTNGLNSYDGHNVKTYRVGLQRSKNLVTDIAQSRDGYIWAATADGVYKVDGSKRWLVRAMPEANGKISCIVIHKDMVYAGGRDGLYISSALKTSLSSTLHLWLSKNHLPDLNTVNALAVDGNTLWVLSNYELFSYDILRGTLTPMNIRRQLNISTPLRNISVAGQRIIIGTNNDGLLAFSKKDRTIRPYIDVDCRVITCLSTKGDTLFVGTDGSGLHEISLSSDSVLCSYTTSPDSRFRLRDNTVYAFNNDVPGVYFFGYFRQGVHHSYFTRRLFHLYPGTEGRNVRSICIEEKRKVLGVRGGLLYIDEERGIRRFFTPKELGGSIVTNVVNYAGQYYCCTFNGGVMRIDPITLTTSRFGKSSALRNTSFGSLCVSPNNELWMSGNAGVYIYNAKDNSERHFDHRNSKLPEAYCNDLCFDRQGRCWISSASGLSLYDPLAQGIYSETFPKDFFHSARETHGVLGDKENLLFYCADGLMRTNEEMTDYGTVTSSTHFTDETISQVIYDKRHRNYWIATESGLYRFDSKLQNFSKFGREAGLDSREFSSGAIYIDDKDTLWIGTMNGLYYCNLSEAQHFNMGKALVLLDEPEIDNVPGNDATVVSLARDQSVRLSYHWGVQDFSFIPVLLNYCNQEDLCFQYRIGTDGQWNEQDGKKRVFVKGFSLGKNILQIRRAGSSIVSEYEVYVFPSGFFLLEWVAIILFSFGVALVIRQRKLFREQQLEMFRIQKELEETKKKYSRVSTTDNEQQRLFRRLEEYMRTEKPFLNVDLKLSDVASHLECSTVKLSQLFSTYVGKNYYDYINLLRLEEFKRRLPLPQYAHFTLLALAEECGFRRSSFFSTFKKVDGITPMEYVKSKK